MLVVEEEACYSLELLAQEEQAVVQTEKMELVLHM
jgi:hypothetical protein